MAVRTSKDKTGLVVVILDMAIMGLLLSANGAAIAVGILGQYGNSHAQWRKVCNSGPSQPSQEIKVDEGSEGGRWGAITGIDVN
ncbi:hypothetical protein Goari_013775 [Gossypium aridum]|uniref:CASP-like protein n=1 Tax=Gossypium aridum TaxID=34290 RepID=A0A7J8XGB5_GOSAI|nr:hypothetical protein [Gossypium aridum]